MTHVPAILPRGIQSSHTTPTLSEFDYRPLNRVVFEAGGIARLGELARELGGSRVLLVTDPGLEAVGHPQKALDSLREADLDVTVFDDVEENPTSRHVEAGLEAARRGNIDLIVAVGGGSSMDCAKGVNFLYTNGGQMSDYKGFGKATKPMLPSIGVPTTAGTGSEAQSYALIADERSHIKMACGDRKAAFRVCILDPELTVSQPRQVAAVTGIDAVSHALESYVTSRRTIMSQLFAREAWRLLEPNLNLALSGEPKNLEVRRAVQLGAHLAGMAIEHSMLGASHACANPLTAHYGLTHGIAVGVMLPHVIRFNGAAVGDLYSDLTHDVGLRNGHIQAAADALANRVTEMLVQAGLPTSLRECGVSSGILPVLAEEAAGQWTGKFNPRPVSEKELLELYEVAF
jgi:alcohol dehydrogenase